MEQKYSLRRPYERGGENSVFNVMGTAQSFNFEAWGKARFVPDVLIVRFEPGHPDWSFIAVLLSYGSK
eukprot:c15734_g1_i1 orf=697-900(-)